MFPEIMSDSSFSTNEAILTSLRRAGEIIKSKQNADYWMSEEGQAILVGKLGDREVPIRSLCFRLLAGVEGHVACSRKS